MNKQAPLGKLVILFIPWLFSVLLANDYITSYFIAWLGSFLIFYLTISGKIKPIPDDLTVAEQLMRPIFLVQIIFAGYMASTSIFYFLDALGYENFSKVSFAFIDVPRLQLIAQCQRYYCLGHAAFASGIIVFMDYPTKHKYHIEKEKLANLLMKFAAISFPVSVLFLKVPGLSQFYYQFSTLSFIAGTLALAFAIPLKKIASTLICLGFYLFNFYIALISGFKEPIILSVLVLGIFLYPNYKKLIAITFIPLLLILFMLLPTYNAVFRQNAWSGDEDNDQAGQEALDAALSGDVGDQTQSNWDFAVNRLSEIDMFTKFVQSTPQNINYYGLTLVKQSAIALTPRIFWPSKPSTEALVMQRVYDANVINEASDVSAKPAFIVDAYLSYGAIGIFIFLFLYGATAQLISVKAEKLFGGYTLGTALIFSGLFQIMWRGLSFEFLINTVFWSYITMLVVHKVLLKTNILEEV